MKIGLFGGTFNPPHLGHVHLLEHFSRQIGFDKIFVVPDKRPVHKIYEDLALDSERLEMCRLAFSDPKYTVSSMEIDRPTDSYTVFTVRALLEQYPQAEIYLIIGSDMFLSFHKWYKCREILEKCTLCVASRENAVEINDLRSYAFSQFRIYINGLQGKNIILSPMEPFEISSSALRKAVSAGADTSAYLAPDVENYIREKGLYGYRKKR